MTLAILASLAMWHPAWTFTVLILGALLTSIMTVTLRSLAFFAKTFLSAPPEKRSRLGDIPRSRLPKVSVLVPLFQEEEIATALIARLSRLRYPKALLQIVLVLEEGDTLTRDTIARTTLPPWFEVIEVPQAGRLRTKPRALNYALDFCSGTIIGVWDAEDAPEIDQIDRVVEYFAFRGCSIIITPVLTGFRAVSRLNTQRGGALCCRALPGWEWLSLWGAPPCFFAATFLSSFADGMRITSPRMPTSV